MNLKKAIGIGEKPPKLSGRPARTVGSRRPLKSRKLEPVGYREPHKPSLLSASLSSSISTRSSTEPKAGTSLDEDQPTFSKAPSSILELESSITTIPTHNVYIECPCFVRMRIGTCSCVVWIAFQFEDVKAPEAGDLWFNAQWPLSEGSLESGTRIASFVGTKQYFATVVECESRPDTLSPHPLSAHLPKAGQRYITPPNDRGKQHLLLVLKVAEADVRIARGVGTHAKIGDEVVIEELGTKFWMRLLSVHFLPDDIDVHDGEVDVSDNSFDDCDRSIPPTRGPSWVTDIMLRSTQADILPRSPSPQLERPTSRHGVLSTVSGVEAIGLAVLYMANAVEEGRRHSWDSSWIPDDELLRVGQRCKTPPLEDTPVPSLPSTGGHCEDEKQAGDFGVDCTMERARGHQKVHLSVNEDPPIQNIQHSASVSSSQHIPSDVKVQAQRGAEPDAHANVDSSLQVWSYPSPHPSSPTTVHSYASKKDKPLPALPTSTQVVQHHDQLVASSHPPPSEYSLLNVDVTGVQCYPTPSSSQLCI